MRSVYIIYMVISMNYAAYAAQSISVLDQFVITEDIEYSIFQLLEVIENQSEIKFSYNPSILPKDEFHFLGESPKTIRQILTKVLPQDIEYKEKGNYIIIVKKKENSKQGKQRNLQLSGIVIDAETGELLENVSIFAETGENTITNKKGSFAIYAKKGQLSKLEIRKSNYQNAIYEIDQSVQDNFKILLTPDPIRKKRDTLTTETILSPNIVLPEILKINSTLKLNHINIQDSIHKPVSLSVYPGIGTYGNLSGNISYNLAVNMVGYNRAINGFEVSMLTSINKQDVQGVQFAGLSNYVGKKLNGFQVAGIFNKVGDDMQGVQLAGITNANFGQVKGMQCAGINNHVMHDFTGVQMSGIYNYASSIIGVQMTSISNITKSTRGVQISGISNHSRNLKGLQMSSVYNYCDTLSGAQISGIINIAKKGKGFQLGIVNMVDSLSGVPIGLVNIIKNGYMRVGFTHNEIIPINLEIKSGVPRFYTILHAGTQWDITQSKNALFTYGGGIGSSFYFHKNIGIELNSTVNKVSQGSYTEVRSMLLKAYLGVDFIIAKHFSFAGGVSYNAFNFDSSLLQISAFDNLRESYIVDTSVDDNNFIWRTWIGYNVGVYYKF